MFPNDPKKVEVQSKSPQPESQHNQHTWEKLLNLVENSENQPPHLLNFRTEEQQSEETSDEETTTPLNQASEEDWTKSFNALKDSTIKPINLGSPKFFKPVQQEVQSSTSQKQKAEEGSHIPTSSF